MARSSEDTTGRDLMAQHLNKLRPCGDVKMGGELSAFRPIKVPETDEEKLETDAHLLVKPAPVIYVNDSELQLSPLSPKKPLFDDNDPTTIGTTNTNCFGRLFETIIVEIGNEKVYYNVDVKVYDTQKALT